MAKKSEEFGSKPPPGQGPKVTHAALTRSLSSLSNPLLCDERAATPTSPLSLRVLGHHERLAHHLDLGCRGEGDGWVCRAGDSAASWQCRGRHGCRGRGPRPCTRLVVHETPP